MQPAPAPLFRDPIFDGAADPTIIWNPAEQAWWLFYTNRRANVEAPGFAWVHGTDIGIASSADGGRTWIYRGIAEGLAFARGRNTWWAPEIIEHAGRYHMYVSYVPGAPHDWFGTRHILHYTSENLWDWRFVSQLALSSDRVIDACVFRMPGGQWRMWYKDEAKQSHTYAADSDDLHQWRVVGPVITDCAHEGPNVFAWQGAYWMVTDHWRGLGVYRSGDCVHWARQADLLPVEYYHVVFTLPEPISAIAYTNKAAIYRLLFDVAAETLTTLAADPKHLGAQIGATLVLHT